jgi:hypothetical protein
MWRRMFWAVVGVAVIAGYSVGLVSSLIIGAAVTLLLLVLAEGAAVLAFKVLTLRKFPELHEHEWFRGYEGVLVKYGRRRTPRER